jgi:GAF domain-containing protein
MSDPVTQAVSALTRYFVEDATMGETLERVCEALLEAIPPAQMAGISMTVDGRTGTYIFSHPDVVEIDRKQYETGDGPCLDAYRSGEIVLVRSTRDPGPYPDFRQVARGHGVLSVLSMPMRTHAQTVGALNLYADHEDAFGDDDIRGAEMFVSQAAFLLANTKSYWDARTLSENLEQAMKSRATIEQAKGIIMSTTGVSDEEAFEMLRIQSQHEHVKLRDLADEIVQRAQRGRHA